MSTDNDYYYISKKKVKKGVIRSFYVILIMLILSALIAPMYCDYTIRAKNSELMLVGSTITNSFTEKGINKNTLNEMRTRAQHYVDQSQIVSYVDIKDDGSVFLFSVETGTFLQLTL